MVHIININTAIWIILWNLNESIFSFYLQLFSRKAGHFAEWKGRAISTPVTMFSLLKYVKKYGEERETLSEKLSEGQAK